MQFNLRRLSVDEIGGQLRHILEQEGIEFDDAALALLARAADGSMRDGLSLLDQALALGQGRLAREPVADMLGTVEHRHLNAIVEALIDGDAGAALQAVGDVFGLARDLSRLLSELAEMLHRVALIQQVPDYRDDSRTDWEQLSDYAARMDPEDVQLYYQIAVTGRRDLGLAPSMRSGCEMTVLRMFAFRPAEAGDALRSTTGAADSAARSNGEPSVREAATEPPPQQTEAKRSPEAPVALTRETWPEVLAALDLNGSVRAVAGMLAVAAADDARVEFRAARDDLMLVTDRFKASLGKALAEQTGLERRLEFRTAGDEEELVTPAKLDSDDRARAQADAEAAVAADPVVRRMQDKFDAEVVPGSVRPADAGSES
jgi:DNA polymerase-3 subunit gamma/tau